MIFLSAKNGKNGRALPRATKIPDSVKHASVAVDLEREVRRTCGRCRISVTAAAAVIDLGDPQLVDMVESIQVPSRNLKL